MATSWPYTDMLPEVMLRSVDIIRRVVVFPAPLCPMSPNTSPSFTVREIPCTASLFPYDFRTSFSTSASMLPRTTIVYIMGGGGSTVAV